MEILKKPEALEHITPDETASDAASGHFTLTELEDRLEMAAVDVWYEPSCCAGTAGCI